MFYLYAVYFLHNRVTCFIYVYAGYFLNPRHQYSDSVHNDGEVLEGTINVIGRLTNNIDEKIDAMLEV